MLTPLEPYRFTGLESRSITPGNPTGARGFVGPGKAPNSISGIQIGQAVELADIAGPGMIRMLWMTFQDRSAATLRGLVIAIHWDGADQPSVLAPIGDFFGLAHGRVGSFDTPYLGVSEGKGFHCSFPMPFARRCRIVLTNDSDRVLDKLFFQIHYTLGEKVDDEVGRFHAHFRRCTPSRGKPFTMLDVRGTPGTYMGAVMGALPTEPGSWREGDIRFYIDGDTDRATITGTGWSDWFLSGWGLGPHTGLYAGSTYQVMHPDFASKYLCSCYRLHVLDPIHFTDRLRVEHLQLGTRPPREGLYHDRSDDWCATVYWYQRLTGEPLPPLPDRAARMKSLEVAVWEAKAWERMLSGADRVDDVE